MTSRRLLPALLLLFVGSGCAALIYEVVWFQLLELVIGSSAVSMAVLLGTFMGGMCLGSLLLPRYMPAAMHPLRMYAGLELGIGALRAAAAFRDAARRRRLHGLGRRRRRRARHARPRGGHLPAAAHDSHGGDAAGYRSMGSDRRRKASPGSVTSMAAILPGRSPAVCSPGST